ncbi:MAG: hypothetical protein R2720_06825 [Candidatus Nanopelagicales bacterium]
MRRLLWIALGLVVLTGCGTATFTNSFSVVVASPQQVSVFDSTMGESAEWAERTMGRAGPAQPYTTQIAVTDTKMIFDGSPPTSLRAGLYLPAVTTDGYFSVDLPAVAAGETTLRAPFIAWYSAKPAASVPDSIPIAVVVAEGPDGWVVNMTPEEDS